MDPAQLIGASFAGCTIERLLGRGGMGAVYLGRNAAGEARALKFLAAELAEREPLRRRFEREGRALLKVPPHPHVVRVFAVEQDELLELPFIVMELLEGSSLSELVAQRGRLELEEAVRLGLAAARGLDALHRCAIIHRDVKPANLMALSSGGLKVVDLGLAKDAFQSGLTEPGRVLGTIPYMAPEQWEGLPVSEGSDIFGLGATLYRLLSGEQPFAGDAAQVREQCLAGEFVPLRERRPEIPAEVARIVERMMQPALAERHARMREVVAELEGALRGEAVERGPRLRQLRPPGPSWSLAGARRFGIGSDADQPIHLPHPSVDRRHARVSRKAAGFVLRDLRSHSGTRVGDEPVRERPRVLADGDRIWVGQVELEFRDEEGKVTAAYLGDVARGVCAQPLLEALAQRGDPRATLWLLEGCCEDPVVRHQGQQLLARLLGPGAPAAEAEATQAAAQRCTARLHALRALTRVDPGASLADWLAWWCRVRLDQPLQLAPPAPARRHVLRVVAGAPPREVACGDVVLLGRDPKCQLVLERPDLARLEGMALRLHRRLLIRAEAGLQLHGQAASVGFLDPGVPCELKGVRLELGREDAPDPRGWPLDAARFAALVRRRHPAVLGALVARLDEAAQDWSPGAAALYPRDPAAAQALAAGAGELARQAALEARTALAQQLGGDVGPDPRAWRDRLAGVEVGPQVTPLA